MRHQILLSLSYEMCSHGKKNTKPLEVLACQWNLMHCNETLVSTELLLKQLMYLIWVIKKM